MGGNHSRVRSKRTGCREIRKLEKGVEQFETEARASPFTPVAGEGTLPDYQSQADTIPI